MLARERRRTPLMLLDDVMSELDADRRELLAGELRAGGQSVIATTDLAHVPGAGDPAVDAAAGLPGRDPAGGAGSVSTIRAPPAFHAPLGGPHRNARAGDARSPACRRSGSAAAGPAIAAAARPAAERDGVLTVTCAAAVWAQELDLMASSSSPRLNAALGCGTRPRAALPDRLSLRAAGAPCATGCAAYVSAR